MYKREYEEREFTPPVRLIRIDELYEIEEYIQGYTDYRFNTDPTFETVAKRMELAKRIELPTNGLQNRGSTN